LLYNGSLYLWISTPKYQSLQTYNLIAYPKFLKKQKQAKLKISRIKILKSEQKLNNCKNEEQYNGSMKQKMVLWQINEFDKSLAKLSKRKEENIQINKINHEKVEH
jgi:hypothetical protein